MRLGGSGLIDEIAEAVVDQEGFTEEQQQVLYGDGLLRLSSGSCPADAGDAQGALDTAEARSGLVTPWQRRDVFLCRVGGGHGLLWTPVFRGTASHPS